MPIYEYSCPNCGKKFEEWLKISESDTLQSCPSCHTLSQHCISQTSFILKGSGWYVTEYGNKKETDSVTHDQQPSEATSASSGGSTDADATSSSDSSSPADSTGSTTGTANVTNTPTDATAKTDSSSSQKKQAVPAVQAVSNTQAA